MAKGGNFRFRGPMAVFIICLVISASLWLVIRLSGIYTTGLYLGLRFTNIPEDKVLSEPGRSPVVLNIRSQGFKILELEYFQRTEPLIIDVNSLRFRHKNGEHVCDLPLSRFESLIIEKFDIDGEFLSFTPDTIRVVLTDRVKIQPPLH